MAFRTDSDAAKRGRWRSGRAGNNRLDDTWDDTERLQGT